MYIDGEGRTTLLCVLSRDPGNHMAVCLWYTTVSYFWRVYIASGLSYSGILQPVVVRERPTEEKLVSNPSVSPAAFDNFV